MKLNVTALMTLRAGRATSRRPLKGGPPRVHLGVRRPHRRHRPRPDPAHARGARDRCAAVAELELIWASPRELLNIVQADEIGCHIITVTHDLLKKLPLLGKDLDDYSLETVQMFHRDAQAAGYRALSLLEPPEPLP